MYTIMSFVGGGIRGLFSSQILTNLTARVKKPLQPRMMAGTSTGSNIISFLLAGYEPAKIVQDYRGPMRDFFMLKSDDPYLPAYDIGAVAKAQTKLHGDTTLAQLLPKEVLFTSFNVGSADRDWSPILFNNLPGSETAQASVVDAVTSSSAMPGMLGPYKGQHPKPGQYSGNIDGAFVNHDPTLAAIALAVRAGNKLEDISCICFGTGFMGNRVASDTSRWGAQQWLYGPDEVSTGSVLPPLLVNENKPCPILNAVLNGTSTNLYPDLARMLLGEKRYCYLNASFDRIIPENATREADLDYMIAMANRLDLTAAIAQIEAFWQ